MLRQEGSNIEGRDYMVTETHEAVEFEEDDEFFYEEVCSHEKAGWMRQLCMWHASCIARELWHGTQVTSSLAGDHECGHGSENQREDQSIE